MFSPLQFLHQKASKVMGWVIPKNHEKDEKARKHFS